MNPRYEMTQDERERCPLFLAARLKQRWCSSQLVEQKSHTRISSTRRLRSIEQQDLTSFFEVLDMVASFGCIW